MGWSKSTDVINHSVNNTFTNWDDMRIPVYSTKVGGSKEPGWGQLKDDGSGSQGVFTYLFDDSTEEELYFAVQMPHSWKFGTDISPHVHWTPTVNGGAGEVVSWGMEYTLSDIGGVYGNTSIIYTYETIPGGDLVADTHYLSEFPHIDMSGIDSVSAMLICRVFRDATGAGGTDDYGDDAALFEIDFHYQIDSLGSQLEYIKTNNIRFYTGAGSVAFSGVATTSMTEADLGTMIGLYNPLGVADGDYSVSSDDGVSWTNAQVPSMTGHNITVLASDGVTNYVRLQDGDETPATRTTTNYTTWNTVTDMPNLVGDENIIYYGITPYNSKIGSGSWVVTDLNSDYGLLAYDGTDYVVAGETSVKSSSDGETYSEVGTNGSTAIQEITATSSIIAIADQVDATTLGWKYYDGSTWEVASTTFTTVDADSHSIPAMETVNGVMYTIILKNDYSAAVIYTSTDGDTWTTMSAPGSLLPYKVWVKDGVGYMSLADGSFNGWVSVCTTGTTWSTPVQVSTSSLVVDQLA